MGTAETTTTIQHQQQVTHQNQIIWIPSTPNFANAHQIPDFFFIVLSYNTNTHRHTCILIFVLLHSKSMRITGNQRHCSSFIKHTHSFTYTEEKIPLRSQSRQKFLSRCASYDLHITEWRTKKWVVGKINMRCSMPTWGQLRISSAIDEVSERNEYLWFVLTHKITTFLPWMGLQLGACAQKIESNCTHFKWNIVRVEATIRWCTGCTILSLCFFLRILWQEIMCLYQSAATGEYQFRIYFYLFGAHKSIEESMCVFDRGLCNTFIVVNGH